MGRQSEQDETEYKGPCPAGTYGSVLFGRSQDGTHDAKDFWDKLTIQQKAAFLALFGMISNDRNLQLNNRQKFKLVEGKLYEFKSNTHQMRIFCFRDGSSWYLTSGFAGKKEDDLPAGEVKKAIEIMENCAASLSAYKSKLRPKDRVVKHKRY